MTSLVGRRKRNRNEHNNRSKEPRRRPPSRSNRSGNAADATGGRRGRRSLKMHSNQSGRSGATHFGHGNASANACAATRCGSSFCSSGACFGKQQEDLRHLSVRDRVVWTNAKPRVALYPFVRQHSKDPPKKAVTIGSTGREHRLATKRHHACRVLLGRPAKTRDPHQGENKRQRTSCFQKCPVGRQVSTHAR